VAQTADSVVILDHGHLIAQSSLAELTEQATRLVRIRTSKADELRSALEADGVDATILAPDRVEVSGATPEYIGTLAAERAIPIFETTTDAPNLEDLFFQLTGAREKEEAPR
jgi:ABC-2 type transport system ATP-binding protein